MNFKTAGFIVVILGVVSGSAMFYVLDSESSGSYCSQLEKDIRQGKNFTGSIACFEPGSVEVNLSEEVERRSDLKCVCKRVQNGQIHLIPITVSD